MKFIVALVVLIGAVSADIVITSGALQFFGNVHGNENIGERSLIVNDCKDGEIGKATITFPGYDHPMVIQGIKYTSENEEPIDVSIVDSRIGEASVTLKVIAKCGHRSNIKFYGVQAAICPPGFMRPSESK